MNIKAIIASQYLAALEMLEQAVLKCPESLWNSSEDKAKFWHVAYHALFYTHLYLQNTHQDFTPWHKHRENYNYMGGRLPWPPHTLLATTIRMTRRAFSNTLPSASSRSRIACRR